jgi:hypothetical protein
MFRKATGGYTMSAYALSFRLAALATAALFYGTPAIAQSTSIGTEYLMTLHLPKDASLSVDPTLTISPDPTGGWVKGKVSGRVVAPSADWVRIVPGDGLRLRLDARVIIETDEHEIIYVTYNGRMSCNKEAADRLRNREVLKTDECYLISAPTFQTKSEKYSWLNDVQAIGKMVEYSPGKDGHLTYDVFVIR